MRFVPIALALVTAVLAHGPAQAAGLDAAFGNTIVSTYPDGRTAELWLDRDGAYSAEGRRHDRSSGRWSLKGDRICLRQSKPWSPPVSFCTPVFHGGVGATWTAKAVTGEQIHVRLVAGRAKT